MYAGGAGPGGKRGGAADAAAPNMLRKHKSFMSSFSQQHPNQKSINKHELKTLDTFVKSIKDDKDWFAFCKLFQLYFDGIISWREFGKLYNEKFCTKVTKPEI